LGLIQKMRMLCNGTKCYDEKLKNQSSKIDALEDLLESGLDNCVIFTNWIKSLKSISETLEKYDKSYVEIYGEINTDQRNENIKKFRRNEVQFIVGDSAMGYGVNLQTADKVLMFDCPWSWAEFNQRIDRVHRIGQKDNVLVLIFSSKDTIEERVIKLLKNKKEMFDIIMNEHGKETFFIKNM